MGVRVEIAGIPYEVEDYSVTEASSPVSLADTSQSTGNFSVSVLLPEVFRPRPIVYEAVDNTLMSPIPTLDRISFDGAHYRVESVQTGDDGAQYPTRAIRVTKLTNSSTAFFSWDNVLQTRPPEKNGTVKYRARGSGAYQAGTYSGPVSTSTVLWASTTGTIQENWYDLYSLFYISPGETRDIIPRTYSSLFRLPTAGSWIEVSCASLYDENLLTGDSPDVYVREGTREIRTTYRWAGPRNDSPTIVRRVVSDQNARDIVRASHPGQLKGLPVVLRDSDKGWTSGVVTQATFTESGVDLDCVSDLDKLARYGVVAQSSMIDDPYYAGLPQTLGNTVRYYANLVGVPYILVDSEVEDIRVTFPSWTGESWDHLKQLSAVYGCEISFVSGVPVFRPIRGRVTEPGRWVSRRTDVVDPGLALSVEAYNRNTRPTRPASSGNVWDPNSDEIVLNFDSPDNQVYSGVPGETSEFTIQLRASVYYILASAFIFDDNGNQYGWGETSGVSIQINENDPSQLILTIAPPRSTRAERIYVARINGEERTPGLRVIGRGVRFDEELMVATTGVSKRDTSSAVGATLDSPFLTSPEVTAFQLKKASYAYSKPRMTLSGTVTNVNRRGDTGVVTGVSYADVAEALSAQVSDFTYGGVAEFAAEAPRDGSYGSIQGFADDLQDGQDYRFQEFGNVAGSRVWDEETRRWYRVRSATITRDTISIDADDDLTLGEAIEGWASSGMTYGQVQESLPTGFTDRNGFYDPARKISYGQVEMMGASRVAQ